MTSEEIVENNKLIADFMGYEYIPHNNKDGMRPGYWRKDTPDKYRKAGRSANKLGLAYHLCRRHRDLRYYNEYNWLMPVVEKIETLDLSDLYSEDNFDNCTVDIEHSTCFIWVNLKYDPARSISSVHNGESKIKAVYNAVIKFIEWYNEQK